MILFEIKYKKQVIEPDSFCLVERMSSISGIERYLD